jgi:hypothetical protein
MASEIYWRSNDTGKNVYATVRNMSRQYYNTATPAFESLTVANWGDYDIALTETPASSYFYVGDMPAVSAGFYWIDIFERAGASPAIGDELLGTWIAYWDATNLKPYDPQTGDSYAVVSDSVPANVKKVNDITVAGSGTTLDPWGPTT